MRSYRDLDIELAGFTRGAGRERFRVRVIDSPAGGQRDIEASTVEAPADLRTRLGRLDRRELSSEELVALGEVLGSLLLPPSVRDFYYRSLERLGMDEGLRLRIRADTAELGQVPWEYSYVCRPETATECKGPEGFLALDRRVSIVRFEVLPQDTAVLRPVTSGKIHFIGLLAEPDEPALPRLDLQREELNLRHSLDEAEGVRTRFLQPGRLDQLEDALREPCEVFHFAGHGELAAKMGEERGAVEGTGRLLLAREGGGVNALDADQLALMLTARGVRLAFLGACEAARRDSRSPWSSVATALVRRGIPAVVGMQATVRDVNAVAFGRSFYAALTAGRSVDSAVTEGRVAVHSRGGMGERDWGTPVLYLRSRRSILFPPPQGRMRSNALLLLAPFLLLSVWFALHIEPYLSGRMSVWLGRIGITAGGLAVLAGAAKVIAGQVNAAMREVDGSRLMSLLRRRWLTPALWVATVVAALLAGTTTSLYLESTGGEPAGVTINVKTQRGQPFDALPQLEVTAQRRLDGRPLVLHRPPGRLIVSAQQPVGWTLRDGTIDLMPWRRGVITIPRDLERRELRILRLALNTTLDSSVPGAGEPTPDRPAKLLVRIGSSDYHLEGLGRSAIYLGAGLEDLKQRIAEEPVDARNQSLEQCLLGGDRAPLAIWNTTPQLIATRSIAADEAVRVEVVGANALGRVAVRDIMATELSTERIETKCLGRNVP